MAELYYCKLSTIYFLINYSLYKNRTKVPEAPPFGGCFLTRNFLRQAGVGITLPNKGGNKGDEIMSQTS
ncbi:MAG: hypothetical protein MI802_13365, partial [Desulfobacterales bacterium]|nr:hypothetical protein [Desulfobacterales bacterium]